MRIARNVALTFVALFAALVLCGMAPVALAEGNAFVIDDQANLLTASQENQLKSDYMGLTEYADVAFVSVRANTKSTETFAHNYVNSRFGERAALIFVIDMDNREIWVYANEAGLSLVSRADARAITDNIYKLASKGDYYACADAAFSQLLMKCEGGRIARPVKHITNTLIAVVLGVLVTFLYTKHTRSRLMREGEELRTAAQLAALPELVMSEPVVTRTEREYKSSSSDGGGGGGVGGGGGGGGHSF
ncbi:MAG: TPM domain-containing protein [Coriobacteriales bacterium]|nr:TPM domain-containing protein [Coriobacteriales bacterium]